MKVKDLIEQLQKLPQDADVYKSNCDGCHECNPYAMENHSEVDHIEVLENFKLYYNSNTKTVIML